MFPFANGTSYTSQFKVFKKFSIFTESQPTIALTLLQRSSYSRPVAQDDPDYNRKNRDVLYVSITVSAVFLFAMSVSILSDSTLDHHKAITEVYAQPYVETVKHRNLTIDLGNGLKTNAQLTIPAIGKGPFPGVIIFPGSGAGSVLPPTSRITLIWLSISQTGDLPYLDMTRGVWGRTPRYQIVMHGAILHLTI